MAEKAKAHVSIRIDTPVDIVFNFIVNPYNMPGVWPSLIEARNVKMQPEGGYTYDWTYKMLGMAFKGSTKTMEYIPGQSLIDQTVKGLESRFTWTFEPDNGATILTVEVVYNIPFPLLGRLAESMIVKQNEREARVMFDNIKKAVEKYWRSTGFH